MGDFLEFLWWTLLPSIPRQKSHEISFTCPLKQMAYGCIWVFTKLLEMSRNYDNDHTMTNGILPLVES